MEQNLFWIAEYNNGDTLNEYENGISHDFKEIEKENTKYFGLIGEDYHLYYDTSSGRFNVIGNSIGFGFFDTTVSKEYLFFGQGEYHDLIAYKQGQSLYNPNTGESFDSILEHIIGYKKELLINGTTFNIKAMLHVPVDGRPVYVTFWITGDAPIKGELRVYKNEDTVGRYYVELEQNIGKEFGWVVR